MSAASFEPVPSLPDGFGCAGTTHRSGMADQHRGSVHNTTGNLGPFQRTLFMVSLRLASNRGNTAFWPQTEQSTDLGPISIMGTYKGVATRPCFQDMDRRCRSGRLCLWLDILSRTAHLVETDDHKPD